MLWVMLRIVSRPVCDNRKVQGRNSISGGGALTADVTLQLRGDVSAPVPLAYYGTDAKGERGWQELPENIANLMALEVRVKVLETAVSALTARVVTAENVLGDHESRIETLENLSVMDGVVWFYTSLNYAVTPGINHVRANAAGITIELPSAAAIRSITVKNATSGIVAVSSVSLIDGVGTIFLAANEAVKCVADATTWNIT